MVLHRAMTVKNMSREDRQGSWRRAGIIVLKLGVAGASLVAIAAAVVLIEPDGGVEEGRALVWDMGVFEQTSTQKFAGSLKHLGHHPPEVYDYNGNEVYFSRKASSKSPDALMKEYQRTFVERGLNDKIYDDSLVRQSAGPQRMGDGNQFNSNNQMTVKRRRPPRGHASVGDALKDELSGLLTGEVVPNRRTDNMVSMVGVLSKGDPQNFHDAATVRREFVERHSSRKRLNRAKKIMRDCGYEGDFEAPEQASSFSKKLKDRQQIRMAASSNQDLFDDCPEWQRFARRNNGLLNRAKRKELFRGFRSIHIRSSEGSDGSTVTAVWSDDTFDLNRAMSDNQSQYQPMFGGEGPAVPICQGCTHMTRFASNNTEKSYETNVFSSEQSPDGVMREYSRQLSNNGWKSTQPTRMLNSLFRRGGQGRTRDYRLTMYERGGSRVLVGAFPAEGERGRTHVTTMFERQ